MSPSIKKTFKRKSKLFYGYRKDALTFKDPEDIHQMRVNGRTLLTFFDVMADDAGRERHVFLKARRPLKKAMGLLGRIRDADVLIDEVEARKKDMLPARRAIIEDWLDVKRAERQAMREELTEKLPGYINGRWKRRVNQWRKKSLSGEVDMAAVEARVGALRRSMDESLSAIKDYRGSVDDGDETFLDALHQGRISVKRLRYALEAMRPFKGDGEADDEIEKLKALQDRLGHIQDMRVWIDQLTGFNGNPKAVQDVISDWRKEMLAAIMDTGLLSRP